MMLDLTLRCVTRVLILVAHNTRIGSDSIHAFPVFCPCIWSQKFGLELVVFACPKLDTIQRKVQYQYCEPALNHSII